MAEKKIFNTSKAPRMSQVFPQAVVTDKFIFFIRYTRLRFVNRTSGERQF
jgi:hypothetical protein